MVANYLHCYTLPYCGLLISGAGKTKSTLFCLPVGHFVPGSVFYKLRAFVWSQVRVAICHMHHLHCICVHLTLCVQNVVANIATIHDIFSSPVSAKIEVLRLVILLAVDYALSPHTIFTGNLLTTDHHKNPLNWTVCLILHHTHAPTHITHNRLLPYPPPT